MVRSTLRQLSQSTSMSSSQGYPPLVAGLSAPALRKAHGQRILLCALSLVVATFVAWEVMMSSWTTRAGPRRILRDSLAILAAAACHAATAFSCYVISDAASPTHSSPMPAPALANVGLHALAGSAIGFFAWNVLAARAGNELGPKMVDGGTALGGLVVGGALCGGLFSLSFMSSRRNNMRFGLPSGTTLSQFLTREICRGLEAGLEAGMLLGGVYFVLRLLSELTATHSLGSALAFLIGMQKNVNTQDASEAGRLTVAYLVFLSTTVNMSLHEFFCGIMHAILTAPQDFLLLWAAGEAASSSSANGKNGSGPRPGCAASMLLDALSVGHEKALESAESDFLQDRAASGTGGGYGGLGGSTYKRGSMGDWAEEVELQRRALAISVSDGVGRLVVPTWAQVARLQALQSLALKAPRSKELRDALYKINIAQVLRTLCLELDITTLLLQRFASFEDPTITPHALACEGRADIEWLVDLVGITASAREVANRRWTNALRDGFTPPFKDTIVQMLSLELLNPIRGGADRGARGAATDRGKEKRPQLSEIRVQSAVWAAESISALMVFAPGESRVWSLDPMLPVVLGSFVGLLLAVRPLMENQQAQDDQDSPSYVRMQKLAQSMELAIVGVTAKYRSCLPSLRFPLAYAQAINRLCP